MALPTTTRKGFLAQAGAAGAVLAATQLAGPAPAVAATIRPGPPLGAAELRRLVAWCDTLVPGAARADVGDFVATQLRKPPEDALLMLRYFSWPPPFSAFYAAGLQALEQASRATFGRGFLDLRAGHRTDLLGRLLAEDVAWDGPPFFLFYLSTRGDAVDVVYGTPRGHRRIGAPYEPLVRPTRRW